MAITDAARASGAHGLSDRLVGAVKYGLWTSVYTLQSSIRLIYTVAGILAGGTQGILESSKLVWAKSLQPAVASRLERLASHPKILPLARTAGLTSRQAPGRSPKDTTAAKTPESEKKSVGPVAVLQELPGKPVASAPLPPMQKKSACAPGPIHDRPPSPAPASTFVSKAPLKGGSDCSPPSSYPATPKLSAEMSSTPPATPGRIEGPTAPLPAAAKLDLESHPVDGSSSKDSTPTKKRRGKIAGPVHKVGKELKKIFK